MKQKAARRFDSRWLKGNMSQEALQRSSLQPTSLLPENTSGLQEACLHIEAYWCYTFIPYKLSTSRPPEGLKKANLPIDIFPRLTSG